MKALSKNDLTPAMVGFNIQRIYHEKDALKYSFKSRNKISESATQQLSE